jgi:hypothetical protein
MTRILQTVHAENADNMKRIKKISVTVTRRRVIRMEMVGSPGPKPVPDVPSDAGEPKPGTTRTLIASRQKPPC